MKFCRCLPDCSCALPLEAVLAAARGRGGGCGRVWSSGHARIAAVPAPGHFGAANRFGPTVCLKCTAAHSTPAHRCFCLLGCENRWSLPNTPPGYWALCTLLSYDSAPFLSCGKFPSGVRPGPVIACHLSGPCPRGPCGAGGLLDLPLVPLAWPRAACAASAGRAGGSWFF